MVKGLEILRLIWLRYLNAVTNQNFIHEEMKSRLDSGNAC